MIFGNKAPKIEVSGVKVLLDFAVIERDETDRKDIIHESNLGRARKIITKPDHHDFVVVIHLHRYNDPQAKYDEIVAHLNSKIVKLWRHRDGLAFVKNGTSNEADFWFESYQELYITTTDYADGLRLMFRSIDLIDHSSHGDNFTFARALTGGASNAWYLDPTSGLMVVTPNTTTSRRLVKGRFKGTAIVIEGAATNLIDTPSGPFGSGNWGSVSMTLAADTGETLDKAGTNIADKLTAAAANALVLYTTSTSQGNHIAGSVWLKCQTDTISVNLILDATVSGGSTQAVTVTTTWKEFRVQANTSSWSGDIRLSIQIPTNTEIVYAWGAGLYDNFRFSPTIVDPTASAVATRASEKFKLPSVDTKLTKLKGTVSMWMKPYFDPTFAASSQFFAIFESGDSAGGATNLHISFQFDKFGGNRLKLRVFRDNNASIGIQWVPGVATGMIQNTWHHLVFTWDATISNGGHIYVDGAELLSGSTNTPFNVSETYDTIAIGNNNFNNQPAFGEYDELFIDDRVWPAEEVLAVFNLPNGLPRTLI